MMSKTKLIVVSVSSLCLLFLALIWVSYFRQRSFDRKDAIRYTIEKNSNLAVALEQYTISTLRNADAVLQLVKIEYAREGNRLNLQKLLAKTMLNPGIVEGVSVINRQGKPVVTNTEVPNLSLTDFSSNPSFIFHSKNNTDSLLISEPAPSASTGRPVIMVSRRLNDSKGNFDGVVVLYLPPSAFTSFYAQARLLPNDIISLIAPNGITYARRTGHNESSGENIHKSPLLIHVANHADSFYLAPDAIRHIPTWFSYRKLAKYPIIATVGSSEQDILYRAKTQSRLLLPRTIVSVLVILFSIIIALFLLHRRRSANLLLKEKERYERLLTEQMIAVQEREREWIGRELHDNVSQVLTTVKLYLEMASKEQDNPLIPRSMQLINSSVSEIRHLSHQLSAPTLGTRSLIDSINALIEIVGFSTSLIFEFDHSACHVPLVMSQKLAIYRILQEQLNNIVKHAEATKVQILLSETGGTVVLKVRDNGKGFVTMAQTSGMGLNNMVSRAKVFEGSVHIQSAPGKGCLVTVTMPVIAAAQEQPV